MAARCFICGEIFPFPAFIGIPVGTDSSAAVCSTECLQDFERLHLEPDAPGCTCPMCKGTGIDPRDVDVPCTNCKGFGDERALDGIDLN